MTKLTLVASAAALTLMVGMQPMQAETVHTKTYIESQDRENVNEINFSVFDVNDDGLYAKSEVGTELFYIFDQDGNEVIDNMEWDDENLYTIIPMEKETVRFVDYNDDGYTELSSYTYETFYKESGLYRFDKDHDDGLSASEFIDDNYKSLDEDNSGMIELDEWEEAYLTSYSPESADEAQYN